MSSLFSWKFRTLFFKWNSSIEGIAYCNTAYENDCSSSGYKILDNEKECEHASKIFGYLFSGGESNKLYPKGCYIYTYSPTSNYDKAIYWNNHTTGSFNSVVRSICKDCVGKYAHVLYYSLKHIVKNLCNLNKLCLLSLRLRHWFRL